MIAVSRQRRQTHTTRTNGNTHTRPDGEPEPAKYQFTTAGHRCAAESTLERAHTLAHAPNSLQTYTHSLPPSQRISQPHSTTPRQQPFCVVVFGGHCFKPREDGEAGKEDRGKTEDPNVAAVVLHGIHQKGVGLSMSRRRTLLMWSSFKRGHLSDQDPCGAMPKWMYRNRGKTTQPLVLKSRWGGKSRQSLEFVGVSVVVVFWVFFFFFKFGNGCRHEPGPERETQNTKKLVRKWG